MLPVGLIGCGRISDIYLSNIARFPELSVIAVASLNDEETKAKAAQYQIPLAVSVDEVLCHPDVDCILNLTIPAAHADITLRALQAGKHVYSEKPFVTDRQAGLKIMKLASEKGLWGGPLQGNLQRIGHSLLIFVCNYPYLPSGLAVM